MDKTEIRLECIKLAVTRTADIANCLAWGEELYAFVVKDKATDESPKPVKGIGKKSENAEILP